MARSPAPETHQRWNDVAKAFGAGARRQLIGALAASPAGAQLGLPDAAIAESVSVDRDAFEETLRHHHLPTLAEPEYIRWLDDPFVVERGRRFAEVGAVFQALRDSVERLPVELVAGCEQLEAVADF